jgi:hypothetical protein
MTRDDATVLDRLVTDAVPAPRTAGSARGWTEPVQYARGTRPRSDYWDVENARWTSRRAVPAPRSGS